VTNAEAGKRAAILESEGQREAQVRKAEGEKEAAILRAQGMAEARLALANAEAEAIRRVAESLPEGQAAMYLLGLKYFESLPKMSEGKGSTIFLPSEATGVMGAVGALRELLAKSGASSVDTGAAKRSGGPVSANTAAYPVTRPAVQTRAADTPLLPPDSTER
jgi:hypothetical protein